MVLFIIVTILVVILDQITKFFIESNLYNQSIDLIKNVFSFTYLENYGAAFGILSDNNWILNVISPALIGILIYYFMKFSNKRYEKVIGGVVGGGAIGNYIDRIFRGYVVDFIDLKIWPIFNLADICIVVGCVLLCINFIKKEKSDGN